MNSRISFWRWLALLLTLLLVPAVCVMAAFASQLQITSPYFSLSFGPPRVQGEPPLVVLTGGPNFPPVVNAEPPSDGPPVLGGGPQQPPGNNPANPAGSSCLLGLLCLSVDAGVGSTPILNVDLGKDATSTVASVLNLGQGSNQCLLGILCISTATGVSQVAQSTASVGCQGLACVDVDAGLAGEGGDIALQVGAEVPVVGTQLNVDANVASQGVQVGADVNLLGDDSSQNNDNDEGLNINVLNAVEVGVGGGTDGVSIGLNLPGLFP